MRSNNSQKFFIKYILLAIFVASNVGAQNKPELNCFTVIVGKEVSQDGCVTIGHNEDDYGKQCVNIYKTPAQAHSETEKVTFFNEGKINQVKTTNGFIWVQLPGMQVADSYVNDKGVLITSNGCPSIEDKPDSTDGGILYWIRRLVAERATTAKEGAKLAGKLIDSYGYVSAGRTYTIADKNEAWVLSAVYGKHWVAQKVPDNQVAIIPNYYTIGEIDLKDTSNFLGSKDIISYAEKRGWYKPSGKSKFNFAKAYTALTSINHPGNINRIWRGISLLSKEEFKIDEDLPFSFIPYKKLDIEDVMTVLRDHYELSDLDKSEMYENGDPHKKNYATICSESTQYSFVAQLRKNMPVEIGTLIWFTYFRPAVHTYTPIYLGINKFPDQFAFTDYASAIENHLTPPESIFDTNSTLAYWDFVKKVNKVDNNFGENFPKVKNQNGFYENSLIRETQIFENEVMIIYKADPELAIKMINDYSNKKLIELRENVKRDFN
ncbi:MAG: C69 family dipeptidase [Ignavibacteriae bacterium]|nr:C69 family dipeptidase [Ignavibacteriota bacterium]